MLFPAGAGAFSCFWLSVCLRQCVQMESYLKIHTKYKGAQSSFLVQSTITAEMLQSCLI